MRLLGVYVLRRDCTKILKKSYRNRGGRCLFYFRYRQVAKKSEFWPSGDDSTAVSNKRCMPVNLLGVAILFDPWFTQYKVKGD